MTDPLLIPLASIALVAVIVVTGIVFSTISSIARHQQSEKSRREVAAYVAEGSITAEEGERLLKAGRDKHKG